MSLATQPEIVWVLISVIAVAMVLGCLRVIGFEYHNAVRWHDLRVEVKKLRIFQEQRLEAMMESVKMPSIARGPRVAAAADAAPAAEAGDAVDGPIEAGAGAGPGSASATAAAA